MSSEKMDLQYSEWKIFLDGVEIPWQSFNVIFSKNSLTSASIVIPPDNSLKDLRPQSIVSVWFRERYAESQTPADGSQQDVLNNFTLYWEGMLSATTYSKSGLQRNTTLECEDFLGVYRRTLAFTIGLGEYKVSSFISGSLEVNRQTLAEDPSIDLYSSYLIATNVFKTNTQLTFSQRINYLINEISSNSATLRQQVIRLRLLNRLFSVNDSVFETVIQPIAIGLAGVAPQQISDESTVMDLIKHFLDYGFYNTVQIPTPHLASVFSSPETHTILGDRPNKDRLSIPRDFQINEFAIVPDTHYTAPPPCNLIFPNQIQSISVAKNFYESPTRVIIQNPINDLASSDFYIAPESLFRRQDATPVESLSFFGILTGSIETNKSVIDQSPYINNLGDGYGALNVLKLVLPSEIEKGVVPHVGRFRFETAVAYAEAQKKAESNTSDGILQEYLSQVVEYLYQLYRFRQNMTVTSAGSLRYLVPGFPAVVFDNVVSYIGMVDSISTSVDSSGNESTTVTFSYVRALRYPDRQKLTELLNKAKTKLVGLNKDASIPDRARNMRAVLDDVQAFIDQPVAPAFFNKELLTTTTLDKFYRDTFGCKNLYTTSQADTFKDSIVRLSQNYFDNSIGFTLATIYTLYKIYDSEGVTGEEGIWQKAEKDKTATSLNQWTETTFTKRTGIKLRDYLKIHGLELNNQTADPPGSSRFWWQYPAKQYTEDSMTGTSLRWDDTIFSKLVNTTSINSESERDPAISNARRAYKDFFLSTQERQQLILKYSRKMFGAKGFSGK